MGCFIYFLFGTSKDITLGPTAIMSLMTALFAATPVNVEGEPGNPTYAIILSFTSGIVQLLMGILSLGNQFLAVARQPKSRQVTILDLLGNHFEPVAKKARWTCREATRINLLPRNHINLLPSEPAWQLFCSLSENEPRISICAAPPDDTLQVGDRGNDQNSSTPSDLKIRGMSATQLAGKQRGRKGNND